MNNEDKSKKERRVCMNRRLQIIKFDRQLSGILGVCKEPCFLHKNTCNLTLALRVSTGASFTVTKQDICDQAIRFEKRPQWMSKS